MLRIQDTKTNVSTEIDATIEEMIHSLNWARRERERCRLKDAKRRTGNPPGRPRKFPTPANPSPVEV